VDRMVESADLDEQTGVLEIGPGIGSLTRKLSEKAGKVVCVEIDRALSEILAQTLDGCSNTEVLYQDIMRTDIAQLCGEKLPFPKLAVCANLPYYITTPILERLFKTKLFRTITVMVQKECAQRFAAAPGSSACTASSVLAQYYTTPEIQFHLPPSAYIPPPKVDSSVIRFTAKPSALDEAEERCFFRVVNAAYSQRRKTLVNALSGPFSKCGKASIAEAIRSCGYDEKVRGEVLCVADLMDLSKKLLEIEKNT